MKKFFSVVLFAAVFVSPAMALADSQVTATAGAGATVSPSGVTTLLTGVSQIFTFGATAGYFLSSVSFDGDEQGAVSGLTVTGDLSDHSIVASATASGGGLVYGSSPLAPGWRSADHSNYIPYNGTSCPFNQGCMITQ